MGCEIKEIKDDDGNVLGSAIICGGRKVHRCQVLGCTRTSEALCDWSYGRHATCDMRLCSQHRHAVGRNRDYCPNHYQQSGQTTLLPQGGPHDTPSR